jgi:hypothetical protein
VIVVETGVIVVGNDKCVCGSYFSTSSKAQIVHQIILDGLSGRCRVLPMENRAVQESSW